jgi:DNA-binding GntR family transcriptional regulator
MKYRKKPKPLMWCRTGYDKMYARVKEEIEREVQSGRYFKGDDADTSNVDGDIVELQRGHELPEEPELPEESIVDEKAKDGNKIDPSEGEPELRLSRRRLEDDHVHVLEHRTKKSLFEAVCGL